ncbi:MAG: chromate transporter [Sphaerochaetaceae bacterium]|nr:chromate transporter [Sphaerochaetaceae bacterium]
MIYIDLFLGFLKVGIFAFGGAYGAIPLIRDVVLSYGWITDDTLTYMIAVSESTPGPIMVNLATYIGSNQAGVFGALLATTAVVLPSFVIILLLTAILKNAMKNRYVKAVLMGLKPSIIGIILATGILMIFNRCINSNGINIKNALVTALLIAILYSSKYLLKKKLSPILLIVLSAFIGLLVF